MWRRRRRRRRRRRIYSGKLKFMPVMHHQGLRV